ncbi:SDR family oxidoreductase [Hyphomonas sp. NPDC076900]|uniref:SDR family oxidoreductase n=1 Tax=unclassified Hyphomonas TaxID=2630699 RepID=UPI003CFF4451
MIAITGATGQLGRLTIAALKRHIPSSRILALVRSPEKATDLGVAARKADYTDPASLEAALAGVDKLLLISSNEIGARTAQHRNVIDAAKGAGVKLIAYTSLLHADTSPLSLAEEHRETEALLKASGVPYILLRNGWYTENYTGSIGSAIAAGALIGSTGDGAVSAATRADLAEAAAVVLATEGHAGKTYELAGDTAFTMADLAAEISRQTGNTIPYSNLPEAEYAAVLTTAGLPEAVAKNLAHWDFLASRGALFDETRQLRELIGRPTTPLADAVRAALGS